MYILIFNFDFGLPICRSFFGKKYLSIGIIKSLIHVMFIFKSSDCDHLKDVILWSSDYFDGRVWTACPGLAKLKIAIGWRSKIGWSDWSKLIREFIFYLNFGRQYLGFLWLVSRDSGLVGKPLSQTICVPIFRWIGWIVVKILHSKDWIYYSLHYGMIIYMDCFFLCKQVAKVPTRPTHGLHLSCNCSWDIG